MGKLLGIDYGEKRIGLALSDGLHRLAMPWKVLEGEDQLWASLERLMADEDIEGFVLGLPKNMNGSLGPKAKEVLSFKERLEQRSGLPVETWDERLTTVEAERYLLASGVRRRDLRGKVDKVAAQILLQNYLDRWRKQGESGDKGKQGNGL